MRVLAIVSGAAASLLLMALFVALLGQVVLRPFGILFPWVEEFATFAFVVMVFFAVALAHATQEHLSIGFLNKAAARRSQRALRWLRGFNGAAELAFLLVLLTGLILMARQSWAMYAGSISGFRHGYVYLVSAVAAGLSVVIVAIQLARSPSDAEVRTIGP